MYPLSRPNSDIFSSILIYSFLFPSFVFHIRLLLLLLESLLPSPSSSPFSQVSRLSTFSIWWKQQQRHCCPCSCSEAATGSSSSLERVEHTRMIIPVLSQESGWQCVDADKHQDSCRIVMCRVLSWNRMNCVCERKRASREDSYRDMNNKNNNNKISAVQNKRNKVIVQTKNET